MFEDEDPGWSFAPAAFLAFMPGFSLFLRRRLRATDGLVAMRQLFLSFTSALVMFGIVLTFLWPAQSKLDRSPGLAMGLVLLSLVPTFGGRSVEKPLDCTDAARLAGSYRMRFFLRIAFAESAALLGFVGFFVTSEWWTYPAGVAIAAVGFARAAPTRARLRRDQEQLDERGCRLSLARAIAAPAGQ